MLPPNRRNKFKKLKMIKHVCVFFIYNNIEHIIKSFESIQKPNIDHFFNDKGIPPYIYHPQTGDRLDLNVGNYTNDNSGFPAGCYIIKQ